MSRPYLGSSPSFGARSPGVDRAVGRGRVKPDGVSLRTLMGCNVFDGLRVLISLVFVGAAWVPGAVAEDGGPPRVDDLVSATFDRVAGHAAGGATLDTGEPGSWFAECVGSPTVDFDGERYRMWFVGGAKTDDPSVPYGLDERIGLATSHDGIDWELANDGQPVLEPGPPGSADAKGLTHPYVLRVGKRWLMWYGAIDGRLAQDLNRSPAHVRVERISLATSDDGIHWERQNDGQPVLDIGPEGSIDSIQATGMHVLKRDDGFVMWYGAYNGRHTIALATSPDGVHWSRAHAGQPLAGLVGGVQGQLGVSVYYDGSRFFMFYCGDRDNEWRMYGATSDDAFHWLRVRDAKPILGPAPEGSFGTAGFGRNHSVHPSQFVVQGRRVRVWYTAEDGSPPHHQRIGLLEATLP